MEFPPPGVSFTAQQLTGREPVVSGRVRLPRLVEPPERPVVLGLPTHLRRIASLCVRPPCPTFTYHRRVYRFPWTIPATNERRQAAGRRKPPGREIRSARRAEMAEAEIRAAAEDLIHQAV